MRLSTAQQAVIADLVDGRRLRGSIVRHGHGEIVDRRGNFVRRVALMTIRAMLDGHIIVAHPTERHSYVLAAAQQQPDRAEAL